MKNLLKILFLLASIGNQHLLGESFEGFKQKKKPKRVVLDPLFAKEVEQLGRWSFNLGVGKHFTLMSAETRKTVDSLFNFSLFAEKRNRKHRSYWFEYQYQDFSETTLKLQVFTYGWRYIFDPKRQDQFFISGGPSLVKVNRFELRPEGGYWHYGAQIGFGLQRKWTQHLYFTPEVRFLYIAKKGSQPNEIVTSNFMLSISYFFDPPNQIKTDRPVHYLKKRRQKKKNHKNSRSNGQ
jgi:hypothetical protein